MSAAAFDDADLVSQSLSGNREAFGQIVERYQSLICSLAYSATGSLGQSEDLAQETFFTAWKQLGELREPQKLRSWLCGIARNLTNSTLRRQGREPAQAGESLDEVSESHSPELLPVEHAIKNEEAQILWRSLERIPQIYREPLILFYREHQSAEKVAQALDLTEDAVHQRLSRGRKLLQEQVAAFVEGALARTNPGKAFTLGVLATLPALSYSAKAATIGATAAKGGGVAKSVGVAGFLASLLGPLLVMLPNYVGYRIAMTDAESDVERFYIRAFYRKATLIVIGLFIPFALTAWWLTRNHGDGSLLPSILIAGVVTIFVPTMLLLGRMVMPHARQYYLTKLAQECGGVCPPPAWEYRSETTLFGLPLVHICVGDRFGILRKPVKAWIAVGNTAIGGLFAFGAWAVAPIAVGGFSLAVLSLGGASLGIFSLGGIAAGVWTFFGGLSVGWQAMGACAVAWHSALGGLAVARDFAVGSLAYAAQANNDEAHQYIESNLFFRCARYLNNHWPLLNLLWVVPFFIQWCVASRKRRLQAANA